MKNAYIVIVILLIAGALWFALSGDSNEEAVIGEDASEEVTNDAGTTMEVPAPGHEDVDEMIVVDDPNRTAADEGGETMEETTGGSQDNNSEDQQSMGEGGNEVVFDLTGQPFSFSVSEIRVKEGDSVTVNFESVKGLHDFVVDEFAAATERVSEGGKTSVTFVADKAGEYEYYCSVGTHRQQGMVGTLIVE